MFGSMYFPVVLKDNSFSYDRLFQSLLAIAAYPNTEEVQLGETVGKYVKIMKKIPDISFSAN